MLNIFNNKRYNIIRIVYVVENVFTKRDYERFYINELIENGFEVLIIDVTELIYGNVENSLNLEPIETNYVKCKNFKEFFERVKQFKPYFSVNLVHRGINKYLSRFIISFFLNKKSKLIDYYCVNLPLNRKFPSIKIVLKKFIFIPWLLIRPSYNIVTNQYSIKFAKGKLIKLHENDYDFYLKSLKKLKEELKTPYLLFLDEGGPFHPDFVFQKIKCPLTPEIYYSEINISLNSLAYNLKLEPRVQLHPRVNSENIKKYFNVKISNESTIEAIRDASLIVAHCSTAIQIAVLFKKPIILLKTTQYVDLKISKLLINNFKELLNCPCIWPQDVDQISSIPNVDLDSYIKFQNQFTRIPNLPDKFNSEILIDFLRNEHNVLTYHR
jgi:hypothetical protein